MLFVVVVCSCWLASDVLLMFVACCYLSVVVVMCCALLFVLVVRCCLIVVIGVSCVLCC